MHNTVLLRRQALGYHVDMCYRYVAPDSSAIVEAWGLDPQAVPLFSARYNTSPTNLVPVILGSNETGQRLDFLRWGLIPAWWKQEKAPSLTFNARSEEAADKPVWRDSYRSGRCLMPARGWYEWRELDSTEIVRGKKRPLRQPYYFFSPHAPVIAFAALMAQWRSPSGQMVSSCALLTRSAVQDLAFIHDRMPVVLAPALYRSWLSPNLGRSEVGQLVNEAMGHFDYHPVGRDVNSVHAESSDLIRKLTEDSCMPGRILPF